MKTIFGKLAGCALGVLAASSLALSAQAGTVFLFSGSGSSGYLDPPSTDMPWATNYYGAPATQSWGSPGLGAGDATYDATTAAAMEVEINFNQKIDVASFSTVCGGFTTETRFCAGGGSVGWTPTLVSGNPYEVLFTAPGGDYLANGENYYVNVIFATSAPTQFNGEFTTVPEPATWGLLISGLGLAGFALRRRQRLVRAV